MPRTDFSPQPARSTSERPLSKSPYPYREECDSLVHFLMRKKRPVRKIDTRKRLHVLVVIGIGIGFIRHQCAHPRRRNVGLVPPGDVEPRLGDLLTIRPHITRRLDLPILVEISSPGRVRRSVGCKGAFAEDRT